jgi:ribosomal protein L3
MSLGHEAAISTVPAGIGSPLTPSSTSPFSRSSPRLMGGRNVTTQNLMVERIDLEHNVVYVRGAVPGPPGHEAAISTVPAGIGSPLTPSSTSPFSRSSPRFSRICAFHPTLFPGKKMAGRMGGRNVTTQNLMVERIDLEHNVVYV